MNQRLPWSLLLTALLSTDAFLTTTEAFVPSSRQLTNSGVPFAPLSVSFATDTAVESGIDTADDSSSKEARELTQQTIAKLRFRELISELELRGAQTHGTTSQLRKRLREIALPDDEDGCIVNEDGMGDDCEPNDMDKIMDFVDESDPFKALMEEVEAKASVGHWKAATRKLKKLTRRFADREIPEEVYTSVLQACMANRLQGARAAEPARKILEQLVEAGYGISEADGNYCIQNCLGSYGSHSTHQGFGGIDTALAMKAALQAAGTPISPATNDKLCVALAKEGSITEAVEMLRNEVVEMSETPPLSTFAEVAYHAVSSKVEEDVEKVLNVLAYAKAAGYELDKVAAIEDGRALLAAGVVGAEKMNNDALGFRLLTAAGSAEGVAPDRGDTMVALSSSQAQRACMLIHRRAISKAVEDGEWQLAVKVLELMIKRALTPSPWVWRNVVTCCARNEKSRKATALLLDWVKLYNKGKAEQPPLTVFNSVINACEICNEQELTLLVLDAMKKTHDTDGNLITFNIALKRLAKLGNYFACEGIIIGMLKEKIEPSIVTYTTAIAACVATENKYPTIAYEWLQRMRTRNVKPNAITYNTAMASCLDGTLQSTMLASKIANEMLEDVDRQLAEFEEDLDEYRNVIPDSQTKAVARKLMQQLKQAWLDGEIDKRVATETIRVPLLKLVDFQKSEAAQKAREQAAARKKEEDQSFKTQKMEVELELLASHRTAEV